MGEGRGEGALALRLGYTTRLCFRTGLTPCAFLIALVTAAAVSASTEAPTAAIAFNEVGARATANYQGDALGITATQDGARLRCGFQKIEGRATKEGLWLESTERGATGKLRLVATAVRREAVGRVTPCAPIGDPPGAARRGLTRPTTPVSLAAGRSGPNTVVPATGSVSIAGDLVRFERPGVTEEYSVSVDGVRQDFVITRRPSGTGELCVALALSGARAEPAATGVRLKLGGSGRELTYSRLRAEDATGRELPALLEVLSADRLAVSVADTDATYPVRIDPTFSDAEWTSLNPALPGANGNVCAMVVDESGNVYYGGEFTVIGTVVANRIAKWNGTTWSVLGSGLNGTVFALAVSGGDLYVGGSFTTAGDAPANGIAKWDGNAWSALGSGVSDALGAAEVRALAADGTVVYAGGAFTFAGGVPASYIAKWNGSTWSALDGGVNDSVRALAISGTNLYIGGHFTSAGGEPARRIARWDGTMWSAMGAGIDGVDPYGEPYVPYVSSLFAGDGDLYVGGHFTIAGTVTANCIARWDGTAWSAFGAGDFYGYYDRTSVDALAVIGTNLYAGGAFYTDYDSWGGIISGHVARWNGVAWSSLGYGASHLVSALAVKGTNLYVGGRFGEVGQVGFPPVPVVTKHVAKWDGSAWSAVVQTLDGPVNAVALSGSDIYIGGAFTHSPAGEVVNNLARWDGSSWSGLGSGVNGTVHALAVSGPELYVGGLFTHAGGVGATNVAAWNGSNWMALGLGVKGRVRALAMCDSQLYAGGSFEMAGGVAATDIAKWDGIDWSPVGSGLEGVGGVYALAQSGSNLYVGGWFRNAGPITVRGIARWNGSDWSPLGEGIYGEVFALAVDGTNLYAGGDFEQAGTRTTSSIARWNGSTWSALGAGVGGKVSALAVSGTNLYAGGTFSIAKWNGREWSGLGAGVDGSVAAIAADGLGHLFVGGDFVLAGTNVSAFFARADNLGSAQLVLNPLPSQTVEAESALLFDPELSGGPVVACEWFLDGDRISVGVEPAFDFANVNYSQSGEYRLVVRNLWGSITSSPVMLSVIVPVERKLVLAVALTGEAGNEAGLDRSDSIDLAAVWQTVASMNLLGSTGFYFELSEPAPPRSFYRGWQRSMTESIPAVSMHMAPAVTLSGNVGDSLRLDYINAIGPIDAWVTLDTVTLTNTSELYFDTSSIDQPRRLYRIVPVP